MAVYEFPTSFGQRRMWLLAEMDPGEPTYNITWAVRLAGALDSGALEQAWNAALVRHEALRTTFRNESGVPVQVIEDDPEPRSLRLTSVEELPGPERLPAATELVRELARTEFDLAAGPLASAALVRLSDQDHVLAVVMHHIVADGWSFRILFDELSRDYAALAGGGEPEAEEPPIQYADYAIWQMEQAEEGGNTAAERFWKAELADAPAALQLPTDRPYPSRQTFPARSIHAALDREVVNGLKELAAQQQTSLFAVLLTAYSVVLARLTGSDDLLIAVPMAARTRSETETVVGLFMNTVPIRVRVDRAGTLADLVRSVHAATARVLEHQELPFARVVELVKPERDPARMPLAQVMFAMEESWEVPPRGDVTWAPELVENGTAKFELELTVTDAPGGPVMRVNYNTDLFDPATGELLAQGFRSVLSGLGNDPQRTVGEAEIMPAEMLAQVTHDWPDGGEVADPGATAVGLLRAACTGDSVLAQGSDGALTGDQIREQAAKITAAITELGVEVSDRVAILLPRGARLLPAILGVWSAGASYVPLDPIYPEQRIAAMLEDSGAAAILVDTGDPDAPMPPAGSTIPVVDLAELALREAGAPEELELPPSTVAVTLFTSGSTGRPKAVSVTQGGIATLLGAVKPLLALGPQDRFVAVSTFAFDIALVELVAPVLAGGRVIVADAWQVLDAARLRELMIDSGATAVQATPAGWRMLVEAGGIPEQVKLRMTAGEPLPRDLADIMCAGEGVRVWNLYGPTETTIYSGGDHVIESPAPIEIGSIISGTRLYLLDDRLRPVPPGVLGEVYIGGSGVAQGYHSVPGLTAGRFLPDPFASSAGARMYRTGDVGKWRPSGRIELAGRADRQIKIRGYRIESGEIESVLRSHADVAQAVVSVRGRDQDLRLVAYLVTRSGSAEAPAGLREGLREVLPDYMVPAAFVVLPAMPLTGSGKIDQRALPEPDWGSGASGEEAIAPRTPAETQLAAIFTEVLTLSAPISVADNFFALGGHSLTATRLLARIRAVFGVELPIRTFFADPTVAGLAAALADTRGLAASAAVRPPRQADRGQRLVPADGR